MARSRHLQARDIRPVVAFLQDELRLRDWTITVRMVPRLSIDGSPVWASCEPCWNTMTAEICLRPEWDVHPALGPKPALWCLIHEFLHIVFPEIRPANGEEAAINRVADALFKWWEPEMLARLDRGMKRKP